MVIKADVQGSAEALADALSVLSTEHASVSVLRAGVGLVAPGDPDSFTRFRQYLAHFFPVSPVF